MVTAGPPVTISKSGPPGHPLDALLDGSTPWAEVE